MANKPEFSDDFCGEQKNFQRDTSYGSVELPIHIFVEFCKAIVGSDIKVITLTEGQLAQF
jgi:hypothetical protein